MVVPRSRLSGLGLQLLAEGIRNVVPRGGYYIRITVMYGRQSWSLGGIGEAESCVALVSVLYAGWKRHPIRNVVSR